MTPNQPKWTRERNSEMADNFDCFHFRLILTLVSKLKYSCLVSMIAGGPPHQSGWRILNLNGAVFVAIVSRWKNVRMPHLFHANENRIFTKRFSVFLVAKHCAFTGSNSSHSHIECVKLWNAESVTQFVRMNISQATVRHMFTRTRASARARMCRALVSYMFQFRPILWLKLDMFTFCLFLMGCNAMAVYAFLFFSYSIHIPYAIARPASKKTEFNFSIFAHRNHIRTPAHVQNLYDLRP